jgi:phage regulator Rha-like protein
MGEGMAGKTSLVPEELIQRHILTIRGHRIMLDSHLAELYGVATKAINRAVKRNPERFPEDFMFRLTAEEFKGLRYQIGTSKESRGGRRYMPYAFTEHGAIMAANVLNSRRAVEVSVLVVRAFVRLRQTLAAHRDLAAILEKLEKRVDTHDKAIREIMAVIRQLMEPLPEPPKARIGFHRP